MKEHRGRNGGDAAMRDIFISELKDYKPWIVLVSEKLRSGAAMKEGEKKPNLKN